MSERMERWAVVNKNDKIVGYYSTREDAWRATQRDGWQGYRVIHLVELRENERIGVDLGLEKREPLVPEMSVADRIETSGERVEPVRTFKVGDRVRLLPGCVKDGVRESHVGSAGTIAGVVDTGFRLQMDYDEGVWYVNKENIEHIKTRLIPERELNAAIERASNAEIANVHIALELVNVKAERDEWKSRALAAESALNDAAAKFEREQAGRIFGRKFVTNGGMKGTYTLHEAIHGAKELRSHYFPPAKEV